MAFIKADHSKASEGFTAIPEGNYETFIESGAKKTGPTGTEYIAFKLKVRDDIEGQSHGGRVLFGNLYFTENTTGIVNGFLKAIGTPDGKEFATIEDLIKFATGKAILAKVGQREYKGEIQNEVKYMNESKVGGGRLEDPFAEETTAPIEVSDDDLPF